MAYQEGKELRWKVWQRTGRKDLCGHIRFGSYQRIPQGMAVDKVVWNERRRKERANAKEETKSVAQ